MIVHLRLCAFACVLVYVYVCSCAASADELSAWMDYFHRVLAEGLAKVNVLFHMLCVCVCLCS